MTYKLNPAVEKIISPIILTFPNNDKTRYENGALAALDTFDHKYLIKSLQADNNVVVIELAEQEDPNINWCGELAISFF